MNKQSAIKTWLTLFFTMQLIGRLEIVRRARLATKAVRAGYRYTPGEWVVIDREVSVQPMPKEKP